MEKIRTFIAIPLPEAVLAEFEKMIEKMRPLYREVKWVKPHSIHLTLKFLGNLTREELDRTFAAMDAVFRNPVSPFSLTVGGLGAFPNFRRPRVLWVGVGGEGMPALHQLQSRVEDTLEKQGFPREERRYSPHLTVGRIKFMKNTADLVKDFREYPFPEMEFVVRQMNVMRSELKPGGAVYSVLKHYHL